MLQVSPLATVAAKSDAIAAFDFRWLLNPSPGAIYALVLQTAGHRR